MPMPPYPLALTVERLAASQIRIVYPLMRQANPTVTLPQWLQYARSFAAVTRPDRAGILIARPAGQQHPSGAVCYRRHRDMRQGSILIAEHFITLDLLYPDGVLRALLSELDNIAHDSGCSAIRTIVGGGRMDLAGQLQEAGHAPEGVTLTKPLPRR